jgi:hypothetical protein
MMIPRCFSVREFTPNVIEPSFGIGRILYTLLEHCFWCRLCFRKGRTQSLSPRPIVVLPGVTKLLLGGYEDQINNSDGAGLVSAAQSLLGNAQAYPATASSFRFGQTVKPVGSISHRHQHKAILSMLDKFKLNASKNETKPNRLRQILGYVRHYGNSIVVESSHRCVL